MDISLVEENKSDYTFFKIDEDENEDNKTLIGEKTKVMYYIGDKILIRVISASKQTRKIDFEKV